MKRNAWYNVRYTDENGYFHDDYVHGYTESKRLAKHYHGTLTEVKNMH